MIVATAAAFAFGYLWRKARLHAELLEAELEEERAKHSKPRVGALTPLVTALQTASRVRVEGLGPVLRDSFEDLAGWAEEAEPELRHLAADDGTLTILFTDIEDSTALNEELGDKSWLKILATHDAIVQRCSVRYGGMVVKSQGDGFMIAFAEAEEAVRAAIKIQRTLASNPRRLRRAPVAVRIGVHTGPALEKGGDLFGRNVALAARVTDRAQGGEIVVTAAVSEAIGQDAGLVFVDHSEVELKGLPGTYELLSAEWQHS